MSRRYRTLTPLRLLSLFSLTLALSILCGFYLPGYSQTSQPSLREALTEEIREDVSRHLDIYGEPLSHDRIEKLYGQEAETAGLTYKELVELYEQEYADQKASKTPSPRDQFIPNVGWLAFIAPTAVLAYVTLLKKWMESRFKAIGDWIYRQWSGTRLFRNVALRKYRTALVQNYEELPMPFLKNRDPLKMGDVYVPLKVSEAQTERWTAQADAAIKHEQIDAFQAVADYPRLMVTGEPGSGKSVLLKYLAWSYGQGKLDGIADRPVVILLDLYRLSDPSLNEAKLIQALVDAFDRNQFPNAQNFARNGLGKGMFLLLLDGLDEVNSDVRGHVVGVLRDFLKKYSQCRAVITCRTHVYEGEFSDIADRKLEVVEFTDQQMRRFLKAWEPEMQRARKSVNQMMAALRERPLILKLARNPLLLTLIAYLYTEPAFVLPRSRAEFYEKSTGILLEQREYKGDDEYKHNRYEANEKRRVLQHLALYAQDHSSNLKDRRSLKAEVIREQVKAVLPSLDIPDDETKDILEEIVERSGLFMKIDGGERYIFPHLTIQEYFAAAALEDKETELVQRFETDPTAWREVVKLWCSLANESTSFVHAVYQRDAITGFECLAEAQQVDQELANQIIERFKPELYQPQTDDTLSRAFGAVAANDRSRGRSVFEFLEQTLSDSSASDLRRNAAADTLSRTNLPKAAQILVAWYGNSEPIVRMGDLAVPSLAELAQQGKLQALDDLYAISTPDAATALVPLLWSEREVIAGRAAWYLGGLLPKLGIEEALRDYSLTPQQRQSETLNWIWQPFGETVTSALLVIAGRVAYLLQDSPLQLIPEVPPDLDPRLVIPLCTIQLKPSNLPKSLPTTAATLLEQTESSPQLEAACLNIVQKVLSQQPNFDTQWTQLILTLPAKVKLDLLNRLIQPKLPTRNHWRDIFQVVNYDLRTSWHYRGILAFSSLLSAIAISQIVVIASAQPRSILLAGSLCFSVNVVLVFWLALLCGIKDSLEPKLFWELGPWGVVTFLKQIIRLIQKKMIWPGVPIIYKALTENNFFADRSIPVLSCIAVTIAALLVLFFTLFGKTAIAIFVAIAFAGAGAVTGAIAITVSSATVSPIIVIMISVATGVAGGMTLAAWYRFNAFGTLNQQKFTLADKDLEHLKHVEYLKYLAIFSFPWFCWFPITIFMSTFALHNLLTEVSPFRFPIWQQTTIVAYAFAGLCAALWWRGQWLDARARNPFHGGALGAALGVKR
jgi:hypothetical protein